MIGKSVTVIVDRPLGSIHPVYKELCYPVNYGFVEGIIAVDGEEQDAYILGVNKPINVFNGRVIAVVHRKNDVEDKWVVADDVQSFSKDEIMHQINFQEQYFDIELLMEEKL